MSGRSKSPLRGKGGWGGVKKNVDAGKFDSPIDREQVSGQMQDIFSTVKKLRVSAPPIGMSLPHEAVVERRIPPRAKFSVSARGTRRAPCGSARP